MALYDADFFKSHHKGSSRSASVVVPVLIDLFQPSSVVDVGCGTGLWLSLFREHGISDVLGIDGPWVEKAQREIPESLFREQDLSEPLKLDRTFDLALCLEVAEHLPPDSAELLVRSLTHLSPVVLFSAAIPCQGGEGHVNERWQSFWSECFATRGYSCPIDLRPRFWMNDAVEIWYRQNMACFVANERPDILCRLSSAKSMSLTQPMDMVHPGLYLRLARDLEQVKQYAARLEERHQRAIAELGDARYQLMRIETSKSWRLIQAIRPALNAGRSMAAFLRLGRAERIVRWMKLNN
jgi:SAM-dependent methyltransferase